MSSTAFQNFDTLFPSSGRALSESDQHAIADQLAWVRKRIINAAARGDVERAGGSDLSPASLPQSGSGQCREGAGK